MSAARTLPAFEAKNGTPLYPVHIEGAYGSPDGGTIYVYDGPPPTDPARMGLRYGDSLPIASLTWNRKTIQFVQVANEPAAPWQQQGVATNMWRLAREIEPELRHAPCHERSSDEGEAFVRATSPEQACDNHCGEGCRHRGPTPPQDTVRPLTLWERITRALRH